MLEVEKEISIIVKNNKFQASISAICCYEGSNICNILKNLADLDAKKVAQ